VPVLKASHTAALNESMLSELDSLDYREGNVASAAPQPADEWTQFRQQQDALHQRERYPQPVRAAAHPSAEELALLAEERRFANLEQQRRLLRPRLHPRCR